MIGTIICKMMFYKIRRLSLTVTRSSLTSSLRSTLSTSQTGTTNFRRASGSCPFIPLHTSLPDIRCSALYILTSYRVLAITTYLMIIRVFKCLVFGFLLFLINQLAQLNSPGPYKSCKLNLFSVLFKVCDFSLPFLCYHSKLCFYKLH